MTLRETTARLRGVLFRIHWFVGLAAGLVLVVMGLTGAAMSFEDEILRGLNPGIVTVEAAGRTPLAPDALIARLAEARPGARVTSVTVPGTSGEAAQLRLAPGPGGQGRGETLRVDPYDGRILGEARGEAAFAFILRLHRWLALPGGGDGPGRQITGAAAIGLVFLSLSGLYLRWPAVRATDWRTWLKPALGRRGRPLYWSLHAVIGTWVLVVYLVIALTGLWWSYGWYRAGATMLLTGRAPAAEARAPRDEAGRGGPPPALDPAFAAFRAAAGPYAWASVSVPRNPAGTIRIRSVAADASHPRARDEWRIRPDGRIEASTLYAAEPLGQRIATAMLDLHQGRWFGLPGTVAFMLAALAMPVFAVTGLLLYLGRRRSRRRAARGPAVQAAASSR
ncbi:MAG: PepSY-associated TM helix domain-containing protein [Methylobacterium frigidaeris]